MAIRVEPNGKVTVMAPRFTMVNRIDQLVQRRAHWIQGKLSYFDAYRKNHPPKEFVSGESFPVWGREYRLKIVRNPTARNPRCELVDGRLQASIPGESISVRALLEDWYAKETQRRVSDILPGLSSRMNVKPGVVKVVPQRKRWASCSRKGDLRFNWRLSMMPPSILTYVIVHELAHLKAHNHSMSFWNIVRSVLPDFEKRRLWLRQNEGVARWSL